MPIIKKGFVMKLEYVNVKYKELPTEVQNLIIDFYIAGSEINADSEGDEGLIMTKDEILKYIEVIDENYDCRYNDFHKEWFWQCHNDSDEFWD